VPEEGRFVIPDLQRIGKYDVLERIADGGFATLYRGRDPFLKRLVAIKVCASEDSELRQQFLREAEIAGNLDHPSIVRTFDFGFDPVGPYLVQEYLQGEDLSQLIAQRVPLSPRRRLDLLVQVAEGLAYSHERLVLHLDVKPGNIRVLGRRQAKILDFGIARLASSDAPPPGGMVGTAGYLPPEQVMSKAVDARADVFAFGAMAYELLTFSRPFAGGTISELIKRVLAGEAEPMTRHWRDCGETLENLIGRCLRRDPAARYPSFEVLLPELIAVRDSYPEVADDESIRDRRLVSRESGAVEAAPVAAVQVPDPLAIASSPLEALDAAATQTTTGEHSVAQLPASRPEAGRRRGPGSSKRVLMAGFAAAAVVVVMMVAALLPSSQPTIAAEPIASATYVSAGPDGPAPGLLVVTAAPWGEVTRLRSADGVTVDLPADRVTPLRLWVAPGPHEAEITLAGGAVATCQAVVVEGGAQVCAAAAIDGTSGPRATEYFKELGWWR
jgi:serine/threonine protein kinase